MLMETAQGRSPSPSPAHLSLRNQVPRSHTAWEWREGGWEVACVPPFMKTSEWMVGHTGRAVSLGCVSFSCGHQSPP